MNHILSIGIMALVAAPAYAGSLTPPGAPGSTMKTLDEVEARTPIHAADIPMIINQPGSFYLAENIVYSGSSNGITIEAADVTIDLNGFSFKGPGTGGSGSGIFAGTFETTGTVVRNGTVSNWPGRGVYLFNTGSLVEKVSARENGNNGLFMIAGSFIECTAEHNGGTGIYISGGSKSQNVISRCRSISNSQGIHIGGGGLVSDNICTDNAGHGIYVFAPDSTLADNICSENGLNGIAIVFGTNSVVSGNNCSSNGDNGIVLDASVGSIVKNNNCSYNVTDGIVIFGSSGCFIQNNHSSFNDDEGIELRSGGGRVENNHTTQNDSIGLSVQGTSVALKNTSSGNGTNYSFSATARYGAIINLGSGAIATANPFVNFTF